MDVSPLHRRWIDPSPFPWWEWDVTADRVEFNDLKATILGWDPADFREGGYRAFTGLVHPEDLGKTMEAMVQVLNGTTSLYQVDYRIQDAWGSYRHFFDRGIVLGRGPRGGPSSSGAWSSTWAGKGKSREGRRQ